MNGTAITRSRPRLQALAPFLQQYGIILAFLVLCVVLAFSSEYFLTPKNILNIVRQTSINAILALGMTLVVLTGGIDLSVGSTLALAGIVAASMVRGLHAENAALAAVAGLAVGAGVGVVNGLMVARLAVPPFVATLGMLSIGRGLTYIYSNGMSIPNLSKNFLWIGQGDIAGIPVPIFFFLSGASGKFMRVAAGGRSRVDGGGDAGGAVPNGTGGDAHSSKPWLARSLGLTRPRSQSGAL